MHIRVTKIRQKIDSRRSWLLITRLIDYGSKLTTGSSLVSERIGFCGSDLQPLWAEAEGKLPANLHLENETSY